MGKDLLKELEKKRQMMIKSGLEYGLQNPKTIRLSKELDRLMNQYEDEDSKSNDDYYYVQ